MKAIKALAVFFFVVSIMLGALALRDAYDAKAVEATIVAPATGAAAHSRQPEGQRCGGAVRAGSHRAHAAES